MIKQLSIAFCVLTFNACTSVVNHQLSPTSEPGPAYILSRMANGPVNILIGTGETGWDIAVSQPYEISEERTTRTQQQVQRYVFTPYATIPGLIQCTGGGIITALTIGTYGHELLEYGCPRIAMIEKLKGTALKPSEDHRSIESRTIPTPLAGAILRVVDERGIIQWEGKLSQNGKSLIPYRMVSDTTTPISLTVHIVSNGVILGSKKLPTASATKNPHATQQTWPTPTIFTIDTNSESVRAALIHTLSQTGLAVTASEEDANTIEKEITLEMKEHQGRQKTQTPSLSLEAATVLVHGKPLDRSESQIQLRFLDIKTGKELMVRTWKVGERIGIDRN